MAVALVTGGNRGIGRAVVEQLAGEGHTVLLGSRDAAAGEEVAGPLRDAGHDVRVVAVDVTDQAQVDAAVAEVTDRHGVLDVLVNNAAINDSEGVPTLEADLATPQREFEVNVLGPWRVTQAFAGLLRASEHPRVVNVSSGAGQLSTMQDVVPGYGVSKAALNAVTRKLADALDDDGVKVNSVDPGWVRTDMGGADADRAPAEGAASVVWAATLPDDGPTGGFFLDGEPIDW